MKAKTESFYGLILLLSMAFISYCFPSFMALKTKTESFYLSVRHLFLLSCCLWLIKFETGIFGDLIITLSLVLILRLWLQKPKTEDSIRP